MNDRELRKAIQQALKQGRATIRIYSSILKELKRKEDKSNDQ
jgi:hypothetical protein